MNAKSRNGTRGLKANAAPDVAPRYFVKRRPRVWRENDTKLWQPNRAVNDGGTEFQAEQTKSSMSRRARFACDSAGACVKEGILTNRVLWVRVSDLVI